MEVTRSNFNEFLPQIKEAIGESDFLAIDTELTGLNSCATEHAFDTVEERYQKLQQGTGKFLIIQFGLSAFQYHPANHWYTHKDFNFYVVPRPYSRQAPDPCFLCQASSLDYLVRNGFNFNKMLYEGISYLTPIEEQKLKVQLTEKHKRQWECFNDEGKNNNKKNDSLSISIPDEHRDFIENVVKQVDALMSNENEKVVNLPQCNAFQRKLIYQTIYNKYRVGLDLSSHPDGFIVATKVTGGEKHEMILTQQTTDMINLKNAVGFRRLIEMISESKKLIIGHHMLLDIMHTINQFYHPLPESLEDFKEIIKCKFPHIADTKMIASSKAFKEYFTSTVLNRLLEQLQTEAIGLPEIKPADGFKGYELSEGKLHEAGFDAFITGVCFVGLLKRLAYNNNLKEDFFSLDSNLLKPFVNKLFMLKSYDIQCINLSGHNPVPSRDHVFYVTFPCEWKTIDLVELFQPYGNIYVSWLNDNSALVALKQPHNRNKVIKALVQKENASYKVKTYTDFLKLQRIRQNSICFDNSESKDNFSTSVDPAASNKRRRSPSQEGQKCNFEPILEEEEEKSSENCGNNEVSSSQECIETQRNSSHGNPAGPEVKKQRFSDGKSQEKIFEENDLW